MSDVKIKAIVVADTAKIKANIEKIKPVIRVSVDSASIQKQVGKALANVQMPKNLISASSTETLTRSSPDIQSRINAAPPIPAVSSSGETASADNASALSTMYDVANGAFNNVTGLIGSYDAVKSTANRLTENLG